MFLKIRRPISNEKAFTLIEVIISLVLIGIMAAIAGMGLVEIAQGYVFAKQNAETAQKAQIAMTRIAKELGTTAISGISPSPLSVTCTRDTGVANTITYSGAEHDPVNIGESILIDNVKSFTLTCYPNNNCSAVKRIDVNLEVFGADSYASTFTNSIYIQPPVY